MFVADTNILIHAADEAAPEHQTCRSLVEEWRLGTTPWYLTWSIVYEFLRVVTHPRVLRRPWSSADGWSFLKAVLAAPSCSVLAAGSGHEDVLARTIGELSQTLAGNVLHDVHTAVLMREHGVVRIFTRDTDFFRFPFLDVVDPLAGRTT